MVTKGRARCGAFLIGVLTMAACTSGSSSGATGTPISSHQASSTPPDSPAPIGEVGTGQITFAVAPGGGDWTIDAISAGNGKPTTLLAAPPECCVIEFSRDGRRLIVIADAPDGRIATATVNADGSNYEVLPLPDGNLNLAPGSWAPDGSRIAFEGFDESNPSKNGIYTADSIDGSELVRVTHVSGGVHDVPYAYSPDGSMLLLTRTDRSGHTENAQLDLFVVRTDGTGLHRLNPPGTWVDPLYGGSPASWAPDGRTIAFAGFDPSSPDDARSAVFTVQPDGSELTRITSWGDWSTSAHYSPDGRWIAFDKVGEGGGLHDLFVVHADGSEMTDITPGDAEGGCCAEWSPNSRSLIFQGGGSDEQHAFLWTVGVAGGAVTQVSALPGEYAAYRWTSTSP